MTVHVSSRHIGGLRRAVRLAEENPSRKLTLRILANEAAISPYHFHRMFKQHYGLTLGKALRVFRLKRTTESLISGNEAVITIAMDAGYESPQAFSRAFKAVIGKSPTEVRNDARQQGIQGIQGK